MFLRELCFWGGFDAFDGCYESLASFFGWFSATMASTMGFGKVSNSDQDLI